MNRIPKSSYNAFKLLNMVDGEEAEVQISSEMMEGAGVLASMDKNKGILNLLLYFYVEPDMQEIQRKSQL